MSEQPQTEGRRERKKRETRERILATARELFATRGFEGTTMAGIADSLDVSTQTVFNYFATKDRLLLGLAEALVVRFEQLMALFTDAPAGTFSAVQSTFGPGGAMLAGLSDVRRDVYVEMLRVVLMEPEGLALVKRIDAATERLLARNQRDGLARTDLPAAMLAQMVVQTAMGAVVRWLADPQARLDQTLVSSVIFLHQSIKVRPAP